MSEYSRSSRDHPHEVGLPPEGEGDIKITVSDPARPSSESSVETITGALLPRYHALGDAISQWHPPSSFVDYTPGSINVRVFGYWHNKQFYRLLPDYILLDGVWLAENEVGVKVPVRALDLGSLLHVRSFKYNRTTVNSINKALRSVIEGEHEYSPSRGPFVFRD